jgi:ParB/RepB/Spo0J family partition protein
MELMMLPIDDITIGERFRKDYKLSEDFLDSILSKGIIQPITINQNYELVAGGRRIAGAKEVGLVEIPVVMRETVDELDLRECELMENLFREDLAWVEKNALIAKIHELNEKKHNDRWSLRKTSALLNRSVGGIHRAVQMHKDVTVLPKLAEFKTEDEAVKMLRKMKEKVAVSQLVESHERHIRKTGGKHDNPKIANAMCAKNHFCIGDAFVGMQEMLDEKLTPPLAFVEVDPPYGIDLKEVKKGEKDRKLDRYEEIDGNDYPAFLSQLCQYLYDVTPGNTRVCFWFGIEWYEEVRNCLKDAGFNVDPIPCIWAKSAGQTNAPERYLARAWEPFFIASKGEGIPIAQRGRINVFNFSVVPASRKYHPTERPVELMQEILRTFAWPGNIIMVPFLGSGTTLRAAYREGMTGFGWELNEENKEPFLAAIQEDIEGGALGEGEEE